jgi:dTDP-4-amino-4,6-dideoxygalactose transaminase
LTKEPNGDNNNGLNLKMVSSFRDGFFQILENEKKNGSNRILLPAYIGLSLVEGSGLLDPVTQSGFEFEFYKLGQELDPDIEDILSKIDNFRPSIVLIVNYFGWEISNREDLFEQLKKRKVKTIEDDAHNLYKLHSHEMDIIRSDYQIFSIHKTLGCMNGGVVVSESKIPFIDETIDKYDLLAFASSNQNYIHKIRQENYYELGKKLSVIKTPSHQIFFRTRRPSSPLNFPILMANKEVRHIVYTALIKNNIFPTSLYHRLIPNLEASDYPEAHNISNRILNLPIHQDVSQNDLTKMAEILSRYADLDF